jgi:hypothetical protein
MAAASHLVDNWPADHKVNGLDEKPLGVWLALGAGWSGVM